LVLVCYPLNMLFDCQAPCNSRLSRVRKAEKQLFFLLIGLLLVVLRSLIWGNVNDFIVYKVVVYI
jgi:hypothetical protein